MSALQMTPRPRARGKRQRLEECGCCACAFRRTTLQEEGDFDAAKEALHQHIRHLVVAGQSEAAAALTHTFEAEVRSASELWAAGCAAMDADFALLSGGGGAEGEEVEEEEEEEAAWATACAAALPEGVLASVAQQAVARARAARPPLDPHGCASGLSHLPCAKCQNKCHGDARSQLWGHARLRGAAQGGAEAEEEGDDGVEGAGGEGGEHDVCILEEKTFEQRQEERLAQAKRDQRYVELSSDDDDGGGGGGGGDEQPTGRAAAPPAATEPTLPRHNARAAAAGRAATAAEARATAAGARVAAASPAVAFAAAARRLPVASSRQPPPPPPPPPPPLPLRSSFVQQQQAILDAAHAQQQASLHASERAAVAAAAEAEAAEAAEAISVTISLAAGAPAATARRAALWRAAAAGSPDEQLDRLAAAEVAAGGCGGWWGRAADEALMRSRRCALCGRSLGDLPPVAGVGYLLEVDAAGDVIASTSVTVGETTSLLAISPPCGHPLHQLCARAELRRLNMPEPAVGEVAVGGSGPAVGGSGPAVDGVAVRGSGAAADLDAASERAVRPNGIALLWRCPHEGCSTQER